MEEWTLNCWGELGTLVSLGTILLSDSLPSVLLDLVWNSLKRPNCRGSEGRLIPNRCPGWSCLRDELVFFMMELITGEWENVVSQLISFKQGKGHLSIHNALDLCLFTELQENKNQWVAFSGTTKGSLQGDLCRSLLCLSVWSKLNLESLGTAHRVEIHPFLVTASLCVSSTGTFLHTVLKSLS